MSRADQVVAAVEGATLEDSFGQTVVRVPREGLVDAVQVARDAGFIMFIDLCAVDYLSRNPRYEVVVNLLCLEPPERVRILAGIPGEDPTIASITGIYAGADFYERETFDLFGIGFEGHPDLTRILLPEEWEGHPLRKDHPMGSVPVVFKHTSEQSS